MIRTQIQLTEKQAQALKELAIRRRESLAGLVRECVETLIHSTRTMSLKERRIRAIEAAGRFKSARDLSGKHDKHLSEVYR